MDSLDKIASTVSAKECIFKLRFAIINDNSTYSTGEKKEKYDRE